VWYLKGYETLDQVRVFQDKGDFRWMTQQRRDHSLLTKKENFSCFCVAVPLIGLGTYRLGRSTFSTVKDALVLGYR